MASETANKARYYITCDEARELIKREAKMEKVTREEMETMLRHFCTCLGCMNYYHRKTNRC